MIRIGKLLLIAALLALPIAMSGCPAEEDTGGVPVPRKSASPTPSTGLSGGITG